MANVAKKAHKDSSHSEKEIKKRRHEESSEDEDEEEEHDQKVEGEWSIEDSHRLLLSIMMLLPRVDVEVYSEQEAQIDWERVAFGIFSADQCREHWRKLTQKVRLYRTMSDLVIDAIALLPRPSCFKMIQMRNEKMNLQPYSIKKRSSLPKIAMNIYSFFTQENMKTLSHIPSTERMKHISQLYKRLSMEERDELYLRFEEVKRNHIKVLQKIKEVNPALKEDIDTQIVKLQKSSRTPKKKNISVVKQDNSLMVSDQSSDDLTQKSAFKPQGIMTAKGEHSSTSDSSENEEMEEKQGPVSPKKGHSAIPEVVSHKKEEKQGPVSPKKGHSAIPEVVSHKKVSEPSQSKKRKKKKEDVVTGLNQFVKTKMADYQQKFPELNDKEIAMKLAGRWERLPDKKKNKYEKLALKKKTS